MSVLFDKVCFIGVGLIGSSLARVMKRDNLALKIVGVARRAATRARALSLGFVDEATDDIAAAVTGADLVVLCTPVGSFQKIMVQAVPFLKDGCVVTDVGSVKKRVVAQVMPLIPKNVAFVPAHPVAGTEKSGPENGFDTLFKERWCIITPCRKSTPAAIDKITALWTAAGMTVDTMSPSRHDATMAMVSHVPHLIAYTIINTAMSMERKTRKDVVRFGAGGFRDFTRIAASDPVMWRDIFLENTDAVLDVLDCFSANLEQMKQAILAKNADALEKTFARAQRVRQKMAETKEPVAKTAKV